MCSLGPRAVHASNSNKKKKNERHPIISDFTLSYITNITISDSKSEIFYRSRAVIKSFKIAVHQSDYIIHLSYSLLTDTFYELCRFSSSNLWSTSNRGPIIICGQKRVSRVLSSTRWPDSVTGPPRSVVVGGLRRAPRTPLTRPPESGGIYTCHRGTNYCDGRSTTSVTNTRSFDVGLQLTKERLQPPSVGHLTGP